MANILSRYFFGHDEAEERAVSFADLLAVTSGTAAGRPVTMETSMRVSAVWACVRVLHDSISTLPLDSFVRLDGVRKPYRPRPTWLNFQTGPWTKTEVLGQVMVSLLLDGNAFLATYRDGLGRVVWVEVLDPLQVQPERAGSEVLYRVGGQLVTRMDVLHIRGMTMPGQLRGMSPIQYARETIALADAATIWGGALFKNKGVPGSIVEAPAGMSPAGKQALREAWADLHGGAGNAHRLAVLTEGAKFSTISVPPNDAQFLETRNFQVADIARLYGVPTTLLAMTGGVDVGTSIEEKNLSFVQHSLRPWVERLEEALSWLLTSDAGVNASAFVKLNVDGLLRGDFETRWATYGNNVREGLMTINEVRALEDLPPVEWGARPVSVQVQAQPGQTK